MSVTFPEPLPAQRRGKDWVVDSDGVAVKLTNLAKPYWEPEGYTKGDLLTYYWNVAERILPYLRDRPLTLKRMPNGADGEFFYQKQAPRDTPSWLRRAAVVSADSGKRVDYLLADHRAAVLWIANSGCIEFHPWHARVDDLGAPDYAFFDLDPMGSATFSDSAEVALLVRTVIDRLGLRCYPRTSGATGMQVYVPIERRHSAEEVRRWVGAVFALIARAAPDRATMTWEIERRGDRVFLDHNMNTEGKNIAAAYCLRPERGAPVATPLTWEEVERGVSPTDFTIATVWDRWRGGEDLFAPVLAGGQDLRAAMATLGLDGAGDGGARHRVEKTVDPPAGDLAAYDAKRDFSVTPEPGPAPAAATATAPVPDSAPRFVIQHHLATRLHHDLRLEQGGTARSWAIPKGLPEVPGMAHLAVQTEDHPLEYLSFSGRIPKGEYGAGEMRIWDRGTYETVEWLEGKVTVRLHGVRHTGEYHLFRPAHHPQAPRASDWLVTRAKPPAVPPPPPPELAPMLASSWTAPFDDDGWTFELKWDGIRAVATTARPGFGAEGATRLMSRLGNDITGGYPELADLWERVLAFNAVLDGELVALDPQGKPSFELLQSRMHLRGEQTVRAAKRTPVTYVVFDVLVVDGEPLIDRSLGERMAVLADLVVPGARVVRSEPVRGAGKQLYDVVIAQGLEGIVGKRLNSRYLPGRRSPEWRKIKVRRRTPVVIGGWLAGEGNRASTFGALLVGFPEGGALRYAGRVGTGFDGAELDRLLALLRDHATDTPPFADLAAVPAPALRRGLVHWCRPELVCTVEYAELTTVGHLRAPAYKGLLPDAHPATVTAP